VVSFEAVLQQAAAQVIIHCLLDALASIRFRLVCPRHIDVRVDPGMHVGSKAIQISHPAVVCQVKLFRLTGHDAVNRLVGLFRVKARRRCGRVDKFAVRRIAFAVRNAKTIAREYTARRRVIEDVVVPRMTFGVKGLHGPPAEIEPALIVCDHHARLVDRDNVAVHRARELFAIDADRTGDESFGIHHVGRPARMNDAARVGQMLHQKTGTASVVKVYVCQKNEVDVANTQAPLVQSVEQVRNAVVRAGIDEGAPTVFNDQVARILQRPQVLRIDGEDAIVERSYMRWITQALWSRGPRDAKSKARAWPRLLRQSVPPVPP